MAAALEAFLEEPARVSTAAPAPGGTALAAGVAAGAAGAALGAAGVAGAAGAGPVGRPAPPAQLPTYPPDAYAGVPGRPIPPPPAPGPVTAGPIGPQGGDPYDATDGDEPFGTSKWVWVAGLLALVVFALVGFLVVRIVTAGGGSAATPSPSVTVVTVPNFVGQTLDDATTLARSSGITNFAINYVKAPDRTENTVIAQNPAAGVAIPATDVVTVDVVSAQELVVVPDLTGKTEVQALRALTQARLTPGVRTEDFDPAIPAGSVIGQTQPPQTSIPVGSPVDYVVSLGPTPTESPTPTPTPAPTPPPTPPPTPTPTPAPTPPPTPPPTPTPAPTPPPTPVPTPTPVTVGTYTCLTVAAAASQATSQGLVIQWQGGGTPGAGDFISAQNPAADTNVAPNSTILLSAQPDKPASLPVGLAASAADRRREAGHV